MTTYQSGNAWISEPSLLNCDNYTPFDNADEDTMKRFVHIYNHLDALEIPSLNNEKKLEFALRLTAISASRATAILRLDQRTDEVGHD